jgi:hypothetical protein
MMKPISSPTSRCCSGSWMVPLRVLLALFLGYSMRFAELMIAARSPTRKRTASQPLLRTRQETANTTIDDHDVSELALQEGGIIAGTSRSSSSSIVSQRKLAFDFLDFNVGESLDNFFSTPINAWTWGQWLLAIVLISLVLWCCGCVASGSRRRYSRSSRSRNEPILVD